MSDAHFGEYAKYYKSLDWKSAPAPDVVVYLAASDEVLLQRAMDSRREFETVEPEYFLMMKRVNREWLKGARKLMTNHKFSNSQMNILEIDTDKLDIARDEGAKKQLTEMVISQII